MASTGIRNKYERKDGTEIWFRSILEARFAAEADERKYSWKYEYQRLKSSNVLIDFYLYEFGCWVEVKGKFSAWDKQQLPRAARELQGRDEILYIYMSNDDAYKVSSEGMEHIFHYQLWKELDQRAKQPRQRAVLQSSTSFSTPVLADVSNPKPPLLPVSSVRASVPSQKTVRSTFRMNRILRNLSLSAAVLFCLLMVSAPILIENYQTHAVTIPTFISLSNRVLVNASSPGPKQLSLLVSATAILDFGTNTVTDPIESMSNRPTSSATTFSFAPPVPNTISATDTSTPAITETTVFMATPVPPTLPGLIFVVATGIAQQQKTQSAQEATIVAGPTIYIISQSILVRPKPGDHTVVMIEVPQGTTLPIKGYHYLPSEQVLWWAVEYAPNQIGWVVDNRNLFELKNLTFNLSGTPIGLQDIQMRE